MKASLARQTRALSVAEKRSRATLGPCEPLVLLLAIAALGLFQGHSWGQSPVKVEFGEVAGEPGEVVEVPVISTYDELIIDVGLALEYDHERIDLVGFSVDGTAAEEIPDVSLFYNTNALNPRAFPPGQAIAGFQTGKLRCVEIPPGENVFIGKLQFKIFATAAVGEAIVEPVDKAGNFSIALSTGADCFVQRSLIPEELVAGKVTVLEPSGPRPVGDFQCSQFLDRVEISFSLSDTYDEIEISRDGDTVVVQSGTETHWEESLDGRVGPVSYTVVARRDGESTVPVSCELVAKTPTAPPIQDFNCEKAGLSWTNPVTYDRLLVFKEGDQIAELPGDTQSFEDADFSEEQQVYTVVGELEGFRSPEVNCLANGAWIMEVGDVQVAPTATRVKVPIYVTTSDTARGWDINLDVDQTRLKLINNEIEQSLEGTVGDPVPEFIGHGIGALGIPSVGIIYDFNPPNEFEKDLQVGLRQLVFNFIFEPIGEFSEGETLPVHIARGGWTHDPERITAVAVHPDVLIDGTIHFGSSGLERVKNLQVDVETETAPVNKGAGLPPKIKSVRLSWENGDLYDHLLVERNGETVAQIPGDSTSYVDMEVPNAVFTYKIFGASGARSSFPAATLVSTFSPPGTFLRGDATFDDNVDVSDSIKILRFLFLGGEVLQCEDAADVDDSGILDTTDPIFLLSYLFLAGSPIQAPVGPFPWFDPTPDDLPCGQ